MRLRDARLVLLLAATLGTGACETWYNRVPSPDDLMHAIPWFDHMIAQKSIHPYQRADVPRYTPGRRDSDHRRGRGLGRGVPGGQTTTADKLVNPSPPARPPIPSPLRTGPDLPVIPATVAARGDTLFHTYCAVCHGSAGAGNGIVRLMGAPSLLTARARGYSDGYLYSIIRYGRGVMPRYGDKIVRPDDRWAVVNYVRSLQAASPAPPDSTASAPAAAPSAAGGPKR
jgi:Cytochrome c, mono- and diheme variants